MNFYKFKKIGQGHSIEEISQDFNEGKEGLIRLRGYADSSDRYLAYAPLGINDWMICYVAPGDRCTAVVCVRGAV